MLNLIRAVPAALFLAAIVPAGTAVAVTPEDQAGIESRCHEDAETYGIPTEQLTDYIDGCILSMGGYPTAPPEVDPGEAAPAGDEELIPVEDEMGSEAVPEYGGETE